MPKANCELNKLSMAVERKFLQEYLKKVLVDRYVREEKSWGRRYNS